MGLIEKYPYTNFSEVNLDYILRKTNEVIDTVNGFDETLQGSVKEIKADSNIIRVTKNDGTSYAVTVTASDSFTFSLTDNTHTTDKVTDLDVDEVGYFAGDHEPGTLWAALRSGLSVRIRQMLSASMPYFSVSLTLDYGGSRAYFEVCEGTTSLNYALKRFMLEYNSEYNCYEVKRLV